MVYKEIVMFEKVLNEIVRLVVKAVADEVQRRLIAFVARMLKPKPV